MQKSDPPPPPATGDQWHRTFHKKFPSLNIFIIRSTMSSLYVIRNNKSRGKRDKSRFLFFFLVIEYSRVKKNWPPNGHRPGLYIYIYSRNKKFTRKRDSIFSLPQLREWIIILRGKISFRRGGGGGSMRDPRNVDPGNKSFRTVANTFERRNVMDKEFNYIVSSSETVRRFPSKISNDTRR